MGKRSRCLRRRGMDRIRRVEGIAFPMKPKALLFDFYGTIVEEADEYVNLVCVKILQNSNVKLSPSEMWRY